MIDELIILEQYQEVIFYSESNFVEPQIAAFFQNGLHFDLYTVTDDYFPLIGNLSLFDPNNILPKFESQTQGLELSPEGLERMFHEFTFCLVAFEAAIKRKQIIFTERFLTLS